ncbi:MAG: hypothetical protein LQ340_006979, partial [Diploschistes diacapsis]
MQAPSFFFHIRIDLTKVPSVYHHESQTGKALFGSQDLFAKKRENQKKTSGSSNDRENISPFPPDGVGQEHLHVKLTIPRAVLNQADTDDIAQTRDWRWGIVTLRSIDMSKNEGRPPKPNHEKRISAPSGGLATKGRFEPLDNGEESLGWGVVRLYRDADATPGLYDDTASPKTHKHGRGEHSVQDETRNGSSPGFRDEDCTMLCILAVPSYMTPSDFLGFVGEKTREEVSHFRMIRTERSNRYMVLMKFRSGKKAREWRRDWDGKVFDDME